jgi:hypothetical protein
MKNNRLGCLSPLAITSAIVTLIVLAAFVFTSGSAFFSAGSLNAQAGPAISGVTSHAEIGDNCAACHPAIWEADVLADRCTACHRNIAAELNDPISLHGVIINADSANRNCRVCHPDHRGPDAPLTEIDPVSFPHNALKYSMTGHRKNVDGAPFVCADCHSGSYRNFDQAVCASCHDQVDLAFSRAHLLGYGSDCLACHDGKDSLGKRLFNHANTAFPLTGKHVDTLCTKCHLNARSLSDMQSASTICVQCHLQDEPHAGKFGTQCESCHTTLTWQTETFDHNLADYKLEGKHIGVTCVDCHINRVWKGIATTCASCHLKDDEHKGAFGTDCGLCHKTSDWEDVTFDHNLLALKLEGKHASVQCVDCHLNFVYKGTPTACVACHLDDDKHRGQYGTDCALCHTVDGWQGATFDHSTFPLSNGHAGLACTRCHSNGSFSGTPNYCSGCHADPVYHRGMFGLNCQSCHTTSNWKAKYNGPHPSIDGKNGMNHEGADCRDCHPNTLSQATCLACHDSNNPGDGGGGGGD